MGWPARLLLIRHGKSEINMRSRDENARLGIVDHDAPLVEKGREQAGMLREYVTAQFPRVDVILSSHYLRTMQTAEIAFPGRDIIEEPRLAEMHIGVWRALTDEQLREHMPWEVDRCNREGLYNFRPYAGECGPDVEMRIRDLKRTLRDEYEGHVVACVTHHQWIVLFQRENDRVPIALTQRRLVGGFIPNASVTVYEPELVGHRNVLVPRCTGHAPWIGQIE